SSCGYLTFHRGAGLLGPRFIPSPRSIDLRDELNPLEGWFNALTPTPRPRCRIFDISLMAFIPVKHPHAYPVVSANHKQWGLVFRHVQRYGAVLKQPDKQKHPCL